MISHDNCIFNTTALCVDACTHGPDEYVEAPHKHRLVSYLPLSHIAGL